MGNEIYALRQYLPLVRLGKDSPCLITVSVPFVLFLVCCLIFLSRFLVCVSVFFFCLCFSSWLQGSGENSEAKSPLESGCTPLFIMGSVGFQLSEERHMFKQGKQSRNFRKF